MSINSRELVVIYSEETLAALQHMSGGNIRSPATGLSEDNWRVHGILRRSDTIQAYDLAPTRRTILRQRAQERKRRNV